jgi:hypothetical protein
MNTKMKQIALPLVVVIAVLLAFSSPAAAEGIGGYAGNRPLAIYDHDTINGGLVFETVTDGSMYTKLFCTLYRRIDPGCGQPSENWLSQTQTIEIAGIPDGATIKMARLYNYYCWSTSNLDIPSNPGVPAEADMWFTNASDTQKKICVHGYKDTERDLIPNPINYENGVIQYWDTEGQNYTNKDWDFPSGEFAWDVMDMVTGNGIYMAKITNHDSTPTGVRPGEPILSSKRERFVPFGFGLLVVYEHPDSPEIEYWIAEGCDYLMARFGETPETATTSATFSGVSGATDAALTTVWTHTEGGLATPPLNMMYFNDVEIGPSLGTNINSIDVTYFDVTAKFKSDQNVLEFQDRNDDSCVHNAFLVVEKPKLAKVIKGEAISDLEAIDTTNKHSQKEIDEAIKHISSSLDAALWTDESRLDPKHGNKVFDEEKKAVKHLKKITEEKGKHAYPAIVDEVEAVIKKLTEADELLATVAINDAKNTPVHDPKKQDKVDKEIAKAEEELAKAYQELANDNPDKAIDHFKKAWKHAQHAIKHAQG